MKLPTWRILMTVNLDYRLSVSLGVERLQQELQIPLDTLVTCMHLLFAHLLFHRRFYGEEVEWKSTGYFYQYWYPLPAQEADVATSGLVHVRPTWPGAPPPQNKNKHQILEFIFFNTWKVNDAVPHLWYINQFMKRLSLTQARWSSEVWKWRSRQSETSTNSHH